MLKYINIFIVVAICFLYGFSYGNSLVDFTKKYIENYSIEDVGFNQELVVVQEQDVELLLSKLNLQNFKSYYIEDRLILEGYSSFINKFCIVDNKKINIQISIFDGLCLIGSPLIKKSF